MAHTPGPWKWVNHMWSGLSSPSGPVIRPGDCWCDDCRKSKDPETNPCEHVCVDVDVPNPDDARLIASAPRMLELLREWVALVDRSYCEYSASERAFTDKARALIAEIDGKEGT
jgi:hypothetical protein